MGCTSRSCDSELERVEKRAESIEKELEEISQLKHNNRHIPRIVHVAKRTRNARSLIAESRTCHIDTHSDREMTVRSMVQCRYTRIYRSLFISGGGIRRVNLLTIDMVQIMPC